MSSRERLRDPIYQRAVADLVQALGENGLSSLAALSFLLQPQQPEVPRTNGGAATRHGIGIWGADPNDPLRFRRTDETADEWRYWADESEIVLRSGSFRVVLIGKSTARGYLLDPTYTPAKVLEFVLASASQDIGDTGAAGDRSCPHRPFPGRVRRHRQQPIVCAAKTWLWSSLATICQRSKAAGQMATGACGRLATGRLCIAAARVSRRNHAASVQPKASTRWQGPLARTARLSSSCPSSTCWIGRSPTRQVFRGLPEQA